MTKKLAFEDRQIVSEALTKAIKIVVDRTMANQQRYLNLMSRIEFDKYRHSELVQLSKDVLAAPDYISLVKLLNRHSDILIELAEASSQADKWLRRNQVKVKRR